MAITTVTFDSPSACVNQATRRFPQLRWDVTTTRMTPAMNGAIGGFKSDYQINQVVGVVSMDRIRKIATFIALCMAWGNCVAFAEDYWSQDFRSKKWEIILSPQYTLAKNLGFDGGTTAKINDTWGFGLQIGYNFNTHWNVAGVFSWSQPDYQAVVQPVQGNPGPVRSTSGSLQMNTFALGVTYNILAGPLTPYVEGILGGTYIHTDIADGPPVIGCYWDPWYGQVCGVGQPTKSATYFSYGIGGGLRWDINQYVLLRGGVRQQWTDISNTGVPGFTIIKLDIGFKF